MESPREVAIWALRSKTPAFKKHIAIIFCDLKTPLGARACVQVLCVQKTRCFAFAFLSPLSLDLKIRVLSGVFKSPLLCPHPVPFSETLIFLRSFSAV